MDLMTSTAIHRDSLYQGSYNYNKENILHFPTPKRSWCSDQDKDVDTLVAQMHAGLEVSVIFYKKIAWACFDFF
jgi:hypothetical protein